MRNISILHNSRWGKSRATLQLLRDSNIEPIIINYLLSVPRKDELRSISKKLNMHPSLWIRKSEKDYKNNNLGNVFDSGFNLYPGFECRAISSAGERSPHTGEVAGSNPASPTTPSKDES